MRELAAAAARPTADDEPRLPFLVAGRRHPQASMSVALRTVQLYPVRGPSTSSSSLEPDTVHVRVALRAWRHSIN